MAVPAGNRRLDADGQLRRDPDRRGFALGVNQIAGLAGQFVGLSASHTGSSLTITTRWAGPIPTGVLSRLPAASQHTLTGREFFPSLISGPFHSGLIVVFAVSKG